MQRRASLVLRRRVIGVGRGALTPVALALFLIGATAPTLAGTLDRVREQGKLTLGYRSDARPFSYEDESGKWSRSFAFADLRDPRKLLDELGGPLPLALLGPIAGLAILLPYVGVILSTVPAVAVAYFQYDGEKALLVFLVYTLLQFLEGNVLTPYIVGQKVRLFPLTVMVAFIFWGTIWGIPGAVLAVPLTSAIKVVCEQVRGWEGLARLLGDPETRPKKSREGAAGRLEAKVDV